MKSFVKTIKELWKDPMGRIGIVGVVLLILMAIFAPLLAPYEYDAIGRRFQAPTAEHIFGTDKFGRDIFSRVLYGARVSMEVGLIAVGIGAFFGYLLGLTAGYFEGKVDRVIMCIMDILFAFPSILLAIFISAVLGKGIGPTMVAIGIVNIPVFCRTVRAAVISAKGLEYVKNARQRRRQNVASARAPHLPERRRAVHRAGDAGSLGRNSDRSDAQLPGHGHSAAEPVLGFDALRSPRRHGSCAVGRDVPAAVHRRHDSDFQYSGRLAARRPRPEAQSVRREWHGSSS